jgi:hypothetical protein
MQLQNITQKEERTKFIVSQFNSTQQLNVLSHKNIVDLKSPTNNMLSESHRYF